MHPAECLIVVRRGETQLFEALHERFASGARPAHVIWDRRLRDRRVIIRDDVRPERRRGERRGPEPSTWATHGFLMTRSRLAPGPGDSRSRPRTPPPIAPGRAQALIDSATGPGGASACRHLVPRGLRTDEEYVRLYARLLRASGRQLSSEWPSSRLRSLLPSPAESSPSQSPARPPLEAEQHRRTTRTS
jgi:hypothetical protein